MDRTLRLIVAAGVLVFVVIVGGGVAGQPVLAHGDLESSQPADGAMLERAPDPITLTFGEEPDVALSRVAVVDDAGRALAGIEVTKDPSDPRTLRVTTGELPDGSYAVVWRVVSAVDGHAAAGVVSFGIGVPPLETPPVEAAAPDGEVASSWEVVGRSLFLAGIVLLLGGATIGLYVLTPAARDLSACALVGLLLGVVGVVALGQAQRAAAQVDLDVFLATSVGSAVIARTLALSVAAVGTVLLVATRWRAAGLILAGTGAATAMLAEVRAGHAGAGGVLRGDVIAQWVHVLAVGVWIGGLAALLIGIRRVEGEARGNAIRRFSTTAGIALAVVVVTGTVRAFAEIDRIGDLITTAYGNVLLAKVGALVVLVVLGAVNRYRNVRRGDGRLAGLRKVSSAELVVAAGVLVGAALLAGLPPPTAPRVEAASPRMAALELEGADAEATVRATLAVSPGVAGANRFDARITDDDTGQPIAATRVGLEFDLVDAPGVAASSLELARQTDGRYSAIGRNLALDGLWDVILTIERPETASEIPFQLATGCGATPLGSGTPQIYTLPVPGFGSVQGLVGGIGDRRYEVHFTFIEEGARDRRIGDRAAIEVWRPGSGAASLPVTRLGPGHFMARTVLGAGAWYFQISVVDEDGARLLGCFEEEV